MRPATNDTITHYIENTKEDDELMEVLIAVAIVNKEEEQETESESDIDSKNMNEEILYSILLRGGEDHMNTKVDNHILLVAEGKIETIKPAPEQTMSPIFPHKSNKNIVAKGKTTKIRKLTDIQENGLPISHKSRGVIKNYNQINHTTQFPLTDEIEDNPEKQENINTEGHIQHIQNKLRITPGLTDEILHLKQCQNIIHKNENGTQISKALLITKTQGHNYTQRSTWQEKLETIIKQ